MQSTKQMRYDMCLQCEHISVCRYDLVGIRLQMLAPAYKHILKTLYIFTAIYH